MYEQCKRNTYATLVDSRGHFVDSLGRVADGGRFLTVVDGTTIERYDTKSLLDALHQGGLDLIFLPPSIRLPTARIQVSHAVYERMAKARV